MEERLELVLALKAPLMPHYGLRFVQHDKARSETFFQLCNAWLREDGGRGSRLWSNWAYMGSFILEIDLFNTKEVKEAELLDFALELAEKLGVELELWG